MTGGVADSATTVPNAIAPPNNMDASEYEAPGSEGAPQEELLTACWLVPKVLQSDQVEHTLEKRAWATTPATSQW